MKKQIAKIRSLTGIKNAILKHKRVWLTMDEKSWVFVELRDNGTIQVNFGLDDFKTGDLKYAMTQIYDFLSFKRSIDQL